MVSNFQYLGSFVQNDCQINIVVNSRLSKASLAFWSLLHILWLQRKIQTVTKIHILKTVILPTLLYGLESAVLLDPHICRLQSFLIPCLRVTFGISFRKKNRLPPFVKWPSKRGFNPFHSAQTSLSWSSSEDAGRSATQAAPRISPCWRQLQSWESEM